MTTITFFDVDETLFKTDTLTRVVRSGGDDYTLTDRQLYDHMLGDGERYDYSMYGSAEFFRVSARPVEKMLREARRVCQESDHRVVIVTARPEMDDMGLFVQTFHDHGIDVDAVDFNCVGSVDDYSEEDVPKRKSEVFSRYLSAGDYSLARVFDDNRKNIDAFVDLHMSHPTMEFEAYWVLEDGSVIEF